MIGVHRAQRDGREAHLFGVSVPIHYTVVRCLGSGELQCSLRLIPLASAGLLALTGTLTLAPQAGAAEAEEPVIVTSGRSGPAETVYATCPQGTSLVGGGYDSQPAHTGMGIVADAVNANAPAAS
ncbi:hypothetical protein GA0115246_111489, partial [Streptomyces sp. SolWspMP-sol7th]